MASATDRLDRSRMLSVAARCQHRCPAGRRGGDIDGRLPSQFAADDHARHAAGRARTCEFRGREHGHAFTLRVGRAVRCAARVRTSTATEFVERSIAKSCCRRRRSEPGGSGDRSCRSIVVADTLRCSRQASRSAVARNESIARIVVDLTGSNGKTTLKELVASGVLSLASGRHSRRMATLNNDIGVPLMLLPNSSTGNHDFAVLEMGANHAGERSPTSPELVKRRTSSAID